MTVANYKIIGVFVLVSTGFLFSQETDIDWVGKMFAPSFGSALIPEFDDAYGVAFRDINRDGYPDLYITRFRELNRLLISQGVDAPFKDYTIQTGLGGNLSPRGLMNLELGAGIVDFNNDGLPDVMTSGWGVTTNIYRQNKSMDFTNITENLNIEFPFDGNGNIWSDIDNDGLLDLFITDEHGANHLFKQIQTEKFNAINKKFGLDEKNVSQGAAFGDLDLDGYPDLYVCNWFEPDELYRNRNGKYFERILLPISHLVDSLNSDGVTFGDLDNDGDLDILVTDRNRSSRLYRNDINSSDSSWKFTDVTESTYIYASHPSYSGIIADFNNDGWQDIFFTNIGPNQLYINLGNFAFQLVYEEEVGDSEIPNLNYSTGAAIADLENDGDLDLFVSNKDKNCVIYTNPIEKSNYLRFELEGVKSNRDAIGAKVWLYEQSESDTLSNLVGYREISSSAGYLSTSENIVHFGVKSDVIYSVTVRFPSGREIVKNGIYTNQIINISEISGFFKYVLRTKQKFAALIRQPDFFKNAVLFLLLIGALGFFSSMAIRRYNWRQWQTTIFFVIILTILYLLWSGMRSRPVTEILGVQIIVISAIIVFTIGFMEKLRQVNHKRFEYRRVLHRFSEDMIFIREIPELYKQLITMIKGSMNVKFAGVIEIENNTIKTIHSTDDNAVQLELIELSEEQQQVLITRNAIEKDSIAQAFSEISNLEIDLLIPVKRQTQLFAILFLSNGEKNIAYRQDDITLLTTVANQAALAIENNLFIEETKALTKSLTEIKVRERYVNELEEKNRNLEELFSELKETQTQLIQSEKMSGLGQLVAGVAHELNNPIGYVYANMKELGKYIDLLKQSANGEITVSTEYIQEDIDQLIKESVEGSERVKAIVENLRKFSRLDEAEFKYADIHEGLDSTIMLIEKEFDDRIKLHKGYCELPPIYCMPGQLNQVFMNILLNAIQAIEGTGNIWIDTNINDDLLVIKFKDDGRGIPNKNLDKLFEPFFTTKPVGMGTGLGLSISYGIIKDHNGEITVKSKKDKGTTFIISIPYKPEVK